MPIVNVKQDVDELNNSICEAILSTVGESITKKRGRFKKKIVP